jgi:hypothetical protein
MPTADNSSFFFDGSENRSSSGATNCGLVRILKPELSKATRENGLDSSVNSKNANGNGSRDLKLRGYVGFDKIASQFVNKQVKDGFSFNILCIGMLIDIFFQTIL